MLFFAQVSHSAMAQGDTGAGRIAYRVQPGDVLQISVWNEPELQKRILVAPDGTVSFPLVGEVSVLGKSISNLRDEIREKLTRFISEPLVTVTVDEVLGNKIYVIGQVNNPGEFVVNPMVDVMQALSMAGGTTPYASLNNIVILRRTGTTQAAIRFKYSDVTSGKNLDTNILLQSGDVVVVP